MQRLPYILKKDGYLALSDEKPAPKVQRKKYRSRNSLKTKKKTYQDFLNLQGLKRKRSYPDCVQKLLGYFFFVEKMTHPSKEERAFIATLINIANFPFELNEKQIEAWFCNHRVRYSS